MKQKIIFTLFVLCLTISKNYSQTDSISKQSIEYIDGSPYMFSEQGGVVIGTSIVPTRDDYGRYYQLGIYIRNNTDGIFDFIPDSVSAKIIKKNGESFEMKVYTKEKMVKKIKRVQAWAYALNGFATGLNAGMASYSTSYQTYNFGGHYYTRPVTTYNYAAARAANMAASTQLYMMGQQMKQDLEESTFGYLQRNTIRLGGNIFGFMNIKHQKGKDLVINISVADKVFTFTWNVEKKKKNYERDTQSDTRASQRKEIHH